MSSVKITTSHIMATKLGQTEKIIKKIIRECDIPYDAHNRLYLFDEETFHKQYAKHIKAKARKKSELA